MAGMRVHELAKEFGMTSKELLAKLAEMKIPAKSHATNLLDAYVDKIRKNLAPELEERAKKIKEEEEKKANAAKEQEEEKKRQEQEAHKLAVEKERKRREAEKKQQAKQQAEEAKKQNDQAQATNEQQGAPAASKAPHSSIFDNLLSQIAAENDRLSHEQVGEHPSGANAKQDGGKKKKQQGSGKNQKGKQAASANGKNANKGGAQAGNKQGAKKNAQGGSGTDAASGKANADKSQASKNKRNKKKGAKGQVDVDARSEDDRYRQMAHMAEKLQRDKVLEEARASIAQAQQQSMGRRKKRKERREEERKRREEEAAKKEAEITGVPVGTVKVTSGITVGEFADALGVAGNEIVKRLFLLGQPLTLTQTMSDDLVELIAVDLEREVHIVSQEEEMSFKFHDDAKDLKMRPPVVTVMGHVDHGKTSLLDAIRHTGVAEGEAGGITQAIGASVVPINTRQITFIDTPGHEAFAAMRARGAQVTDIIVLVVAADDGVMPQTIESIDHAQAADVPIVVAVNKIDKPGANPERVKTELSEHGVIPEEWGGKNMFVEVSAKQKLNIDELLETIILQAQVLELKANPDAEASGFVIEANLDKGRGPVATVIVRRGTLRVGDALVAGTHYGRVRALINPQGENVDEAVPADPVEILGLDGVCHAGDEFAVFEHESEARALAQEREMKQRLKAQERSHVSLDNLFERMEAEKLSELPLIIKADTVGSIEALIGQLEKMDQSEVRINVIHAAVGGVTTTDVNLAAGSDAIIIGFNVRPQTGVKRLAERERVDIRLYRIIYQAIDDINAARVGLLAPEEVEVDTGSAKVRELFKVPKAGIIAGCVVEEGTIANTDHVRVVRNGVIVYDGMIASMRHYRDDVEEVRSGSECGIGIEGYQDIKEGDIIEGYRIDKVARKE